MFTELVGAASMFERHGDEDADRGRRELLGVLRRILAEHGGREVTSTHDTLMAAFSSAVSAVDCAIGMQREVTGRGAGATLQIGLDAGEPLSEGRELYGTPVIVAEQLCRAAEPGEILVSAGVRHIVGSRNAGQMPPAGALKLRGVAERTVASRVLWREEAANPAHPLHGAAMTSEMITVVIADDERLLRAGFRVILDSEPDMQVVGEAADGRAAVDLVRRRRPDVVLMDIRMPDLDGLEAAQQILEDPDLPTAVVMLTTFDRSEYLYKALRIGASGFLLKDATAERLLDAVRVTAAGDALLAPTVTRRLIEQFARSPQPAAGGVPPRLTALTARELEVLRHVARGLSNAEIAHALVLGENTIKSHVAHLLGKLGLRDRVQAVVLAYETGLVAPDAAARDAGP
ncbi:MAG TPA: response regulator [Solirubrobacteraceae bacterium]|nr:response regulator [Solirubrobacteraceae bacterium]